MISTDTRVHLWREGEGGASFFWYCYSSDLGNMGDSWEQEGQTWSANENVGCNQHELLFLKRAMRWQQGRILFFFKFIKGLRLIARDEWEESMDQATRCANGVSCEPWISASVRR